MSKNNKGFITIELIVVSVFVLALFGIIYTNSNLAFQAYERKEQYDDIDTKYAAYWIKKYINNSWDDSIKQLQLIELDSTNKIIINFNCSYLNSPIEQTECQNLFTALEIKNVYITKFNLISFKEYTRREDVEEAVGSSTEEIQIVKDTISYNDPTKVYLSSGMYDYIKQSPDYINNPNKINYRVFIELEFNDYNKYGTSELDI